MFFNITDASWTVRFKKESEYLSDEIGIYPTLIHILRTFGTSVEILAFNAQPNLAPCRLFISMATWAFF